AWRCIENLKPEAVTPRDYGGLAYVQKAEVHFDHLGAYAQYGDVLKEQATTFVLNVGFKTGLALIDLFAKGNVADDSKTYGQGAKDSLWIPEELTPPSPLFSVLGFIGAVALACIAIVTEARNRNKDGQYGRQ
ncbi:MAG: hypothetical protein JNM91_08015, partial [Flavobacteriales bacterium]|nr:hypothetical protein [Flavobacteriales bacterium]